jgi:hypothetical protein
MDATHTDIPERDRVSHFLPTYASLRPGYESNSLRGWNLASDSSGQPLRYGLFLEPVTDTAM